MNSNISGRSADDGDDTKNFEDLIQRLRQDDPRAAEEVWQRFIKPLLVVAYRHLDDAIRQKIDPDDIVQSAYLTFFMRFKQGQFELADPRSTLGLLIRITVRKCARKSAYFRTQQRDVQHELPLTRDDSSAGQFSLDGTEPSPDEQAIMAEIIETLAGEFTKPYEQLVVCRWLEGCTEQDISAHVGRSEYTVRRVIRHVRLRLEQMLDEP